MGSSLMRLLRSSLAVGAGAAVSTFAASPYGMAVSPVLMFVFKSIRESRKANGKPERWWTGLF